MFRTPDGKKIADATSEQIFKEINDFLKEPRFAGDSCVVLTMPAAILVKSAEKLNTAILEAYRELGDPKTGMTRILVAIEDYVEVERLAVILDDDIKMTLAKENNISADEEDIEKAKHSAERALAAVEKAENDDNETEEGSDE